MYKTFFISFTLVLLISLGVTASKSFNISEQQLSAIENKYGSNAKKRVELWDSMLESSKNESVLNKIKNVNDFFNRITYKTDQAHWKKKDYWATPFEFMGTGAGDCEDYAIAKYFSLVKLGIPEDKLRITYVTYRGRGNFDQAHMVLTYYHTPTATPVVLDNIDKTLQLATKRNDLTPIYSFNALGLWQAKNKGEAKIGDNNLKSWKDLMSRF